MKISQEIRDMAAAGEVPGGAVLPVIEANA
jgi:hypothetical protein